MKNTACKLTLAAALLFACFAPITSLARNQHAHQKSGIIGQVVQLPGPWHIRIDTIENQFVEDILANDDGSFDVDLKPGTYLLTPFFPSIDGTAELVGVTATVTVNKSNLQQLNYSLSTALNDARQTTRRRGSAFAPRRYSF
jgi:hypothetical protein